jgi:hypothetical protein
MTFSSFSTIAVFGLILAALGGWVANIVKLIGMLDGSITSMFVARVVGIFAAPVGAILGYF